jgi:CheY-like chemotaxis protein
MAASPKRTLSGERPKAPLVLLADDDADVRDLFAHILVREGFGVVDADNGPDAIDKAAGLRPHVIVLDVSLPGMTGIEVVRVLRSRDATRTIPVVAMTGHVLFPSQRESFDYVLTKPCVPDVLVWRIRSLLPREVAMHGS